VVLTLRGMECTKIEVGKMWIERVVKGLWVKVEAAVEGDVGSSDKWVGRIISVIGTVDI